MGNSLISLRALRKRRAWEGARRASRRWLTGVRICLVGLGFACSREPQAMLPLSLPFTVNWQNISGGPQTIEAFRAGVLDGGAVGDTPPIHAQLTGLDIKIITVQVLEKPVYQLALAPGVSVGPIEALRGKRIAYSPGQAQGALVLRVLAQAGLSRDDVQLVELISTEFKDALGSRQVDVAPLAGTSLRLSEGIRCGGRLLHPAWRRRWILVLLLLDAGKMALDLRIEIGAPRSRRSPHLLDYREALLSALGVGAPSSDDEASGPSVPARRARRYPTRLERTA
jgi:hypothetical protein